jgi:FkbM family methyltransferase
MSFAEFIYTEILRPKPLRALANAILLRIIPPTIKVGPATLHPDLSDPVVSGALTLHLFEPSELAFFQKFCRGEMTLVDIGANIGLYSVLAIHALNTNARIIALEPHPEIFTRLQDNIETNLRMRDGHAPDVLALPLAATSEQGPQQLRLNPENRGDNRLYRGTYQDTVENWESLPVEGQPLDDVLEERGIGEVNFVKIDIQGYEQKAIAGFRRTLGRSKRVILMSEFWPKGLSEAGGDAGKYLQDLTDLGFALFRLKERPHGQVAPLMDWQSMIDHLPGRKYANIIGVKGISLY